MRAEMIHFHELPTDVQTIVAKELLPDEGPIVEVWRRTEQLFDVIFETLKARFEYVADHGWVYTKEAP